MKIKIIEHPKCGRTWLFNMMNIVIDINKLPVKRLDRAHNNTALPNREYPYQKREYREIHRKLNHIIFLIRDPRDVINSFYFWATTRGKKYYNGNMSQFIRSKYGIEYLLKFYNDWNEIADNHDNIIPMWYENIKSDTLSNIRWLFKEMGFDPTEKSLKKAVKQTTFDKLRKQEGNFSNSAKFRKGIVGDYRNNFTKKDIDYCNNLMNKYNCDFIKDYKR